MILQNIQLNNFRNIAEASLCFAPGFNFFFGDNGAGKTSILEAIYYLGLGRSFRAKSWRSLMSHQADFFALKAKISDLASPENYLLASHRRDKNGDRFVTIAEDRASSIVEMARLLPVQFIGVDTNLLFSGPSSYRRKFLDNGVFHVEPNFYSRWLNYSKLLNQRNFLLKSKPSPQDLSSWNLAMEKEAASLDAYRSEYCVRLVDSLESLWSRFNFSHSLQIRYDRGWNDKLTLCEAMQDSYRQDVVYGYTNRGPHRAKLSIYHDEIPAVEVLSQGQQKLCSYMLRLCQGIVMREIRGASPLYMIDDLASELDDAGVQKVIQVLNCLQAQVLVTAVNRRDFLDIGRLYPGGASMFHVEHGVVQHDMETI